jgi:hypothetical protein
MKFITLAAVTLLAFSAQARSSASCEWEQVAKCVSTPKSGDSIVAAEILDSILICNTRNGAGLLLVKKGQKPEFSEVEVQPRPGATSYILNAGNVVFTLSVNNINVNKTKSARFYVAIEGQPTADSTYTCKY